MTVLTVASVPAAHPYVSSVVDVETVTLLTDPVPPGATHPGQWWPPQWLETDYLRGRLDGRADIDVLHVHFGFDANAPDQLADLVGVLDDRRVPLVVTVHDLANPHFTDQAGHAQRLDVLVPAADTVITLTDGAADEIRRRWGRDAVVVAHPHVLPAAAIGRPRTPRSHPVVAIHGKNLRANVDPWRLLDRLVDRPGHGWRLRFDLDDEVVRAARAGEASPQRLDRYRRAGVDVRVHRRFSDEAMVDYLDEVDVLVMPYRHGTHSGWIEACHDARVQAVVPDCGYFHRQQPYPVFGYGADVFDADSFDDAVRLAVESARRTPAPADESRRRRRVEQRRAVRDTTTRLYREAARRHRR